MIWLWVLAWITLGIAGELLANKWLNDKYHDLPPDSVKISNILFSSILGPCCLLGTVIYICFISKPRY